MTFATALFELQRGRKVKRHHWTGYWFFDKEKDTIIMHTYKNEDISIKDTKDILYTLSACASDDWEVVKEW